jgi:hypothetical protein
MRTIYANKKGHPNGWPFLFKTYYGLVTLSTEFVKSALISDFNYLTILGSCHGS